MIQNPVPALSGIKFQELETFVAVFPRGGKNSLKSSKGWKKYVVGGF
jgi:hypothetical protein